MEKKFVSMVIYLHNDAGRAAGFLKHVMPAMEEHFENCELICVDDACTDETIPLVKEWTEKSPGKHTVSILHMGVYQGIESAMNAGRDAAIGDFVYEFDDLCIDYPPSLLIDAYEKLLTGYDIVAVSGLRKMKFTSKLFYSLYNKTSRGIGKIGPETFRIISRRAINRVKTMGRYIPYRKAVYANCGLNMTTLSYIPEKDAEGFRGSGKKTGERTSLALDSFIYFTNMMEKVSFIISALFLGFTVIMGIYILADYFNARKPVEGWVSTMGFLSLGFFGVFALLTIILKYLSVLLNLVFRQQRYLVSDIEKLN